LFIFGGFDGCKWLNDICILDIGKLEENEINNEAVNALISNMRKIINNSTFSDVVFMVEGKPIYAHKAILSAQCEHFRAMFMSGMKESSQSQIDVKDYSYNSYLLMIEYLYSGSISNFSPKVANDLLGLADAYMLEGLKYLCENTLMHSVDNDNVCTLLIEANKFSSGELKKFCIQHLIKNFSEVQSTKAFEELEYYPSLLMEVTKNVFANANDKESAPV
jgi:leucine-zipper-like transcriptional regulator 1